MATIGTINIILSASTGPFDTAMKKAVGQLKAMGKDMEEFGKTATGAITVPLAAAGAAAAASALKIDDALDSIRARTGATGAAFETLSEDMRSVFATVPDSVETVADAISGLSQRLGLSGQPLQEMATQMLNLSRLTGTEVGPVIESTTRLFASFGIAAKDQAGSLDFLFKASQQSGIGFDKLATSVNQFGPALRNLGFGFEESVAMIASFERSGVNTEKMMGGLSKAMSTFAKEGIKDVGGALMGTIDQMKNAGTASEAAGIAIKVFGAKAGPELAEAVRSGRLEIGAFLDAVRSSPETINTAAKANEGFAEKLEILRNKAMVAIEPLGVSLLQAFERMLPAVESAIGGLVKLANAFADLPPSVQTTIIVIAGVAAAIGPVLIAVGSMIKGFTAVTSIIAGAGGLTGILAGLKGAFLAVQAAMGPVGLAMTALAILVLAYKEEIADAIVETARFLGLADKLPGVNAASAQSFNRVAQELNVSTDTLKAWTAENKNALSALGKHKDEIAALQAKLKAGTLSQQEYEKALKALTTGTSAATTATTAHGKATGVMGDEAKKAAKELASLKEAFEKSSAPLNTLAKDYDKLTKAGVAFEDVVKAYSAEIVKAGQTQMANNVIMTDSAYAYFKAASEVENTKAKQEALRKETELTNAEMDRLAKQGLAEASAALKKVVTDSQAAEQRLKDMAEALKSVLDDKIKFPEPKIGITGAWETQVFGPMKGKAKDLGDTWLQSVSTMVTDMAKGITDILFAWGGLFETMKNIAIEFSKGIVRAMLENILQPLVKGLMDPLKDDFERLGKNIAKWMGDLAEALGPVWGTIAAAGIAAAVAIGAAWRKLPEGVQTAIKWIVPAVAIASAAVKTIGEKLAWDLERDMGLDTAAQAVEAFVKKLGIEGSKLEDIRKDFLFSPRFLTEFAYPLAQAQGKVEEFLTSLESVKTSWGTFNFREAFQIGLLTGDFTKLNEAFIEAFGSSEALKEALPEWQTELAATAKAADGAYLALKAMFDQFQATGVLTDEFSAKIVELGGNLDVFQAATALPGLKGALAMFTDLKNQVDALLPKQKSANELFLETGHITKEMGENILRAGGNLEVFQRYAAVKQAHDSFQGLVDKFKETGEGLGTITALVQRFGSEGIRNMTITKDNIDIVARAMENDLGGALRNTTKDLSDELGKMNKTLEEQIGFLTKALITSMDALVYAMAGMPDKARELMDALNAEFAAFAPTVVVSVEVDENSLNQANRDINAGVPDQVTVPVTVKTPQTPFGAYPFPTGGLPPPAPGVNPFSPTVIYPNPFRGYQHGGLVPFTGPYILHTGERVVSASATRSAAVEPMTINLSPHIEVNVTGSENTGQDVARELSRLLPAILERNARGFAAKVKRELGLPNHGGAV